MRGYIFVGIILANILITVITMFGLNYFLDLEHNTPIALTLAGICLVGYIATLLLFRSGKNYALCSHFLLGILTTVIFFGLQITGGYLESPILQLAMQIPVMGFLLLGLRAGVFWLISTFLLCIATYFSAIYEVGYMQQLQSEELIQAMYILLQFVILVVVGGTLIIYETINSMLKAELHEEKIKLEHLASHDDLTGVANRFEFFRRLKDSLQEARERDHKVGVIYIDLDKFKPVNDDYGHHAGDEALKTVAERLERVLRLTDTTARLGGDEFGIILPGIHVPTDIELILPKLSAAICEPILIAQGEITISASFGISIYPNHSLDYNELIKFADTAMYRAKESNNTYLVFDESMHAVSAVEP